MTTSDPTRTMHPILRMMRLMQHAIFVVLLGASLWQALESDAPRVWVIVMGIALALVYAAGVIWVVPDGADPLCRAWIIVLTVLWIIAMLLSPDFSWLALALFLLFLRVLPIWPAIGMVVVVTTAMVIYRAAVAGDGTAGLIGPVIGAIVVVIFGLSYRGLLIEVERREAAVQELMTTQSDLVATSDALAEAQHEAGVIAERARLAREIHDTLAQGFSSILLLARAGQRSPQSMPHVIDQIEQTASENLDEARRVVQALGPGGLQAAPLVDAVRRVAERLSEQTGIRTHVRVEGNPTPLDAASEVTLLRVAQSALANVRLHSKASEATVTISYDDRDVVLDIVDDGIGFVVGRQGSTGFGMAAMRDRLRLVGGTIAVESAPGEGTAVSARVPIARRS